MEKNLKIALVTNTLAPYRVPVFSRIARAEGGQLCVICCSEREPNRSWDLPPIDFECVVLRPSIIQWNGRYIHNNRDVISALRRFSPDVVVTDGMNPTHLYAFFYARFKRLPHICMTDGTMVSEEVLTVFHRLMRRFIYARSKAYVAASDGGFDLFSSYHLAPERCFKSCLCIDNQAYESAAGDREKRFDLLFCGRLEPVKNPLFVLTVALEVAKRLERKVSVLFVGSGSLGKQLRSAAALFPGLLEVVFYGHAEQGELPALYSASRVFLFPSLWDPWGVVVNEACAAGLPVIASPVAGASNELVRDGYNGFVCDLDLDVWVEKTLLLLTQNSIYQLFSMQSQQAVKPYTFDNASQGVLAACQMVNSESVMSMEILPQARRPKVLIVERQLLHYRQEFYEGLRSILDKAGIDLQLLIGDGTPAEALKKNQISLDWAMRIPTHYLFGTSLCWQPFGQYAKDADLVIVMHENKILYNLWLMSFGRPKRLAFWGHGRNMQSDSPNGFKERFKRWTINRVDWWFAYTKTSAALIAEAGFPAGCTTVVENAVDTQKLAKLCREVSVADCQKKRTELELGQGPVALYLGSLYKEKRLDFLLDAAIKIRRRMPDFQLLVAGAGPEQTQIEVATHTHPWIHYLGPLQDGGKAVALVLADVILNPGLVGLGILDSFASGTPMFTTDCGLHSPEICYLRSGQNGVMTVNDLDAYAEAVGDALRQPETLLALSKGALSSAPHYTIRNMVSRTERGIRACLTSP